MLRAVFFDFDRTAQDIDTPFETATAAVLGPLCREVGVGLDAVRRSMGHHWPTLWQRHLEGTLPPGALRAAWLATALPAAGIAATVAEAAGLADRYEAAFEAGPRPYDDVLPALEALRSAHPDLPLGLLTRATPSVRAWRPWAWCAGSRCC